MSTTATRFVNTVSQLPPLPELFSGLDKVTISGQVLEWYICTVSMDRIQGLSATLVSSHLAGSRNKHLHFYSPLDGH